MTTTVRDLMAREVVTVKASDDLDLPDSVMRLGRIRHFPVLEGERLVGILTQTDILHAAMSSVVHLRQDLQREWLGRVSVRQAMSSPAVTVTPDTPLPEAVMLMVEKKIGCLAVVEDGRLVGLLSETDCLRHLARLLVAG